jgi:hypothetical protein
MKSSTAVVEPNGILENSEAEGGLEQSTKVVEITTTRVTGQLPQGSTEVVNGWSHRNIICDLEFVPAFPGIITVSDGSNAVIPRLGDEGGLTNGHSQGITLPKNVSPLEAYVPGLTLGAIKHGPIASVRINNIIGNIAIISIDAPAIADGGEPSTKGGLPIATKANGINAVR